MLGFFLSFLFCWVVGFGGGFVLIGLWVRFGGAVCCVCWVCVFCFWVFCVCFLFLFCSVVFLFVFVVNSSVWWVLFCFVFVIVCFLGLLVGFFGRFFPCFVVGVVLWVYASFCFVWSVIICFFLAGIGAWCAFCVLF